MIKRKTGSYKLRGRGRTQKIPGLIEADWSSAQSEFNPSS